MSRFEHLQKYVFFLSYLQLLSEETNFPNIRLLQEAPGYNYSSWSPHFTKANGMSLSLSPSHTLLGELNVYMLEQLPLLYDEQELSAVLWSVFKRCGSKILWTKKVCL